MRVRLPLPIVIPVVVVLVIAGVTIGFAEVLLAVPKEAAVAIALLIESTVLALGLSAFSGFWRWTWLAFPLVVAAIGCQLAVGNIVSVVTPLRLPREGTDVFAQSTEQGCLAIASQTVSFFAIGLLLIPPASVTLLTVSFGEVVAPWFTALFAIGWGAVVYLMSLVVASRLLRRRLPEVMAWVQVV